MSSSSRMCINVNWFFGRVAAMLSPLQCWQLLLLKFTVNYVKYISEGKVRQWCGEFGKMIALPNTSRIVDSQYQRFEKFEEVEISIETYLKSQSGILCNGFENDCFVI